MICTIKKCRSVNLVKLGLGLLLAGAIMRCGFAAAHCGKPLAYRPRSKRRRRLCLRIPEA